MMKKEDMMQEVWHLNELEFVPWGSGGRGDDSDGDGVGSGSILANQWYQDLLFEINPLSGHVTKVYDFAGLYKNRADGSDSFNGISVSVETREDDRIVFVTGKQWPYVFKVRLL